MTSGTISDGRVTPWAERRRADREDRSRSDGELIAAVRGGDVESYYPLVHRYRESYARFARCLVGDPSLAAVALHAAFVRAFGALDRLRDPSAFGAWLYDHVLAECLSIAPTPSSSRTSTEGERGGADMDPLAPMTPRDREVFALHFVEELTLDEMESLTGIDGATLRASVERGRGSASVLEWVRQPVPLGDDFETRVMGAVRAESRVRRKRRLHPTPDRLIAAGGQRSEERTPTPWGVIVFLGVVTVALVVAAIAVGVMR